MEAHELPLHVVRVSKLFASGRRSYCQAQRHAARRTSRTVMFGQLQLRIAVRDDGCGIDPSALKQDLACVSLGSPRDSFFLFALRAGSLGRSAGELWFASALGYRVGTASSGRAWPRSPMIAPLYQQARRPVPPFLFSLSSFSFLFSPLSLLLSFCFLFLMK